MSTDLRTLAQAVDDADPEVVDVPPPRVGPRTCNRHSDCDKADAEAKARGRVTDHCHDDCCEDCFGS